MFVGTAQGHRADAQYVLAEQIESEWVMYFNCQVFNFRLLTETHVCTGDICMREVRDQALELSGGAVPSRGNSRWKVPVAPGCLVCPSKGSQVGGAGWEEGAWSEGMETTACRSRGCSSG